ncbi:MAG: helix-turn-helix domain-containing protein [Candidatus Limnocylindrales bacterium]
MAKSNRRLRMAGVGQLRTVGDRRYWQLVRQVPRALSLSARAKARLAMLDWHFRHGRCVALTADHFGYSRPTVYRWLARYDANMLTTLEDRSSRPARHRRPTWTLAQIEAVRLVRERYPCWGKAKLAVVLARAGVALSASRVGRILAYLRRRGAWVISLPPSGSLSRAFCAARCNGRTGPVQSVDSRLTRRVRCAVL